MDSAGTAEKRTVEKPISDKIVTSALNEKQH